MVVFSAEYWAPAMNNNNNNITNNTTNNKQHNRKTSSNINPKHLLNPVIPNSIFSSPAVESLSDFGAESTKETSTLFLANKKNNNKSSVLKANINGSQINNSCSLKGPNQENNNHHNNCSEILNNVKSVWLDMLASKVNKKSPPSSKGSHINASQCNNTTTNQHQQPLSLEQKYGVCQKRCIGRGASAVVRIAYKIVVDSTNAQKQNKVFYAIKEFRKRRKNETEREYVKKLTGEFCISSTLHHKNVVETIDLIQDEHKNWCEVMEYCPGGDLYNVIKNGSMSQKEIDCCFKQLIYGVEYLHSMGVAHRDIKPENILINEKGLVKITDFGVSDVFRMVWESENHKSRGLCGSEPYIAPEQFKEKEYDARAVDIWACAIVYYAMVNASILFKQATTNDPTFVKYCDSYSTRSFNGFKKLPENSINLMFKMLCVEANKRIKVEEIIIDKWFVSIETCEDCMSSKGFHNHFTTDYIPRKSANSNDNTPQ